MRLSPYLRSLVAASIDTWYSNHQSDTIAAVAASLPIDTSLASPLSTALRPIIQDALDSSWFTAHIREMLQAFYAQPAIKASFAGHGDEPR
ncbi:hypothetical protein [Psychrobacter celer]|uniref:hypothetical protein n=1 Tax=Psychrobacter celer TaxID=306572 RepID=UPI003FCF8FD2